METTIGNEGVMPEAGDYPYVWPYHDDEDYISWDHDNSSGEAWLGDEDA